MGGVVYTYNLRAHAADEDYEHLLWNFSPVNATEHFWWSVQVMA